MTETLSPPHVGHFTSPSFIVLRSLRDGSIRDDWIYRIDGRCLFRHQPNALMPQAVAAISLSVAVPLADRI
jgi:hypothetical protein